VAFGVDIDEAVGIVDDKDRVGDAVKHSIAGDWHEVQQSVPNDGDRKQDARRDTTDRHQIDRDEVEQVNSVCEPGCHRRTEQDETLSAIYTARDRYRNLRIIAVVAAFTAYAYPRVEHDCGAELVGDRYRSRRGRLQRRIQEIARIGVRQEHESHRRNRERTDDPRPKQAFPPGVLEDEQEFHQRDECDTDRHRSERNRGDRDAISDEKERDRSVPDREPTQQQRQSVTAPVRFRYCQRKALATMAVSVASR